MLELQFTSILDRHPDPTFVRQSPGHYDDGGDGRVGKNVRRGHGESWHAPNFKNGNNGSSSSRVQVDFDLDLAMYNQASEMKLYTQRSVRETLRGKRVESGSLDERWRVGSE